MAKGVPKVILCAIKKKIVAKQKYHCGNDDLFAFQATSSRQRRNVKTDKDNLSVRNHYEAISPADLSFNMDIPIPGVSQNGTIVYAGMQPVGPSDFYCMSRGGFGLGLGILLTAVIVSTLSSIFLCIRFRNQKPRFVE